MQAILPEAKERPATGSGPTPSPGSLGAADAQVMANILLVDDEPRNLDVLESILAAPDYKLVRAQTPEDALIALVQGDFVCIVLDIQMPRMNGIELARLIKTRKRCQHIPIIFLTAYFQEEKYVLEGYGAGAVDYLTKPVNPQILKSKVSVFVELFRTTCALTAANAALESQIVQRRAAEEALREANESLEARIQERQQLESLVLSISEREQQRIGQDLHDGLCQQLTGIKFRNGLLEEKLVKRDLPECEDARSIEKLLNHAIELARNQARGLNPVRLEVDGFVAALQELAVSVTNIFNVNCVFEAATPISVGDHSVSVHLYRIAQEGISNAIKHGCARNIRVELSEPPGETHLVIEDDGIGICNPSRKGSGMGLHIMNYRARAIGAALNIGRNRNGGTTVTCILSRKEL